MKVLVVVPSAAGCGAERQAFLHMSALRSDSHGVSCVCAEGSWLAAQCERVGIAVVSKRGAGGWFDGWTLSRNARQQAVDKVFGYGEEGLKTALKIARGSKAQAYGFAYDSIELRHWRGAATVFAASHALSQSMTNLNEGDVRYLAPAVPDNRDLYSAQRASERARLKLQHEQIAVCVPGPIHPDLGQEVALEALEQLGDFNIRLFLLGSYQHSYGKELRMLAAQNPLAANSMIGQPADAGVYTAFDLCLAPFQAGHAAQHALTALSFGLPLVATPVGALQDMVEPGGNGYLATSASAQSIAEALLVTLDESGALARMGKRSRKKFKEHFTLRHMARELVAAVDTRDTAKA